MKPSSSKRRVRPLRAKASAINAAEFEDYGPEPNMKLSHAFMVVLALHVIAVGGLFAFNKVKASHSTLLTKIKTEHVLTKEPVASEVVSPAVSAPVQETTQTAAKTIASHQQAQAPAPLNAAAPAVQSLVNKAVPGVTENPPTPPTTSAPAVAAPTPEATPVEATKEYTIVKGDNPYKLAKRFHVSYDSLMKLNNITDPRKIQIGQKLKIPASAKMTSGAVSKTSSSMGSKKVQNKKSNH